MISAPNISCPHCCENGICAGDKIIEQIEKLEREQLEEDERIRK